MSLIKKIVQKQLDKYYQSVINIVENPLDIQAENFAYLLYHGQNTIYGTQHKFDEIKSISQFQQQVPIITYEDLKPFLEQILVEKRSNVLWDTPVKWFAMSSGTTEDKSKYIPVTQESLDNCHYRCGYHMMSTYARNYPDSAYYLGKTLVLGGSQQINRIGDGIFTGDISAILMKNLPFLVKLARTPEELALIPDWQEKLSKLSDYAAKEDIRALLGVPSWMLVLLKRIQKNTGSNLIDLWPNLEVFFHGGVSFTPYQHHYDTMIPSGKMRYWETYNASEGFFGIQYLPQSKDMLLLLDNEIFYEFIPAEEWKSEKPRAITLAEVQVGKQYALVITTSGGLWRYKLGDTIEFTSVKPYLFRITGRTKQFINAFGEELIVDNAERALQEACNLTNAKINEYTAAPKYFDENSSGAHEWLIEFEEMPSQLDLFIDSLDENLKKFNSDYEAKRSYNLSLGRPVVHALKSGSFYEWMGHRQKLGGQNKVPKLSNDRKYVDDMLDFLSAKS